MTANGGGYNLLDRMRALLQPAGRQLSRSVMQACVGRVVILMAWAVVAGALVELTTFWICVRQSLTVPLPVHLFVATILGAALLWAAIMLARASARSEFAWLEVAQRVDAACDGHNRITTTWSLAENGRQSAFALAAMKQGLEALEQEAEACRPVPPDAHAWRWNALAPACGLVLLVGLLVNWVTVQHSPPALHRENLHLASGDQPGPTARMPAQHRETDRPDSANATQPAPAAKQGTQAGSVAASGTPAARRTGQRQGNSAPGSRGTSSKQNSAGAPGEPEAEHSAASPVAARKASRPDDAQSHSKSRGNGVSPSSGTISGGGAGRGQAVAVKNQGLQREAPTNSELEASEDDEPIDEEQAGNEQRGGVQPSLPDRTEAPSRELGITGPQSGKPGTGRGGPSPAKKARGAAALLMGVPIPDFVKGKAGPGATAVTVEETSPVVSPGEPVPASVARPRSEPESLIPIYDVPWSDAEFVQEYSRRWQRRPTRTDVDNVPTDAGGKTDRSTAGAPTQGAARP